MLEKSFTIKDLIIYLIPGIINLMLFSFFLLSITNSDKKIFELIKNNISLSILGIVISFVLGFILSQFQIIIFKKIFEEKLKEIRKLSYCITLDVFKPIICEEIKKEFKLDKLDNTTLLENQDIFFYCYSYVIEKSNDKSLEVINRSNNLSSFATALFIPIALIALNLVNQFSINCGGKVVLFIFLLIPSFFLLKKIIINFKGDFHLNTFRAFYLTRNKQL